MDAVPVHRRAKARSYSLGLFLFGFGVMSIDDALARRAIPNTYLTYPVFIALKTAEPARIGCRFLCQRLILGFILMLTKLAFLRRAVNFQVGRQVR
jgi:hypothetical protein